MVMDKRLESFASIRAALSLPLAPFQYIVSWPTDFIGNLKIALPPISEQQIIIDHIKTETKTIDTAIAKAEREIELVKEYKEAMIAEAVMGKIV